MLLKFKKRIIVTFLFSLTCLILTNRLWSYYKPIELTFDIIGKGKYQIVSGLSISDNLFSGGIRADYQTVTLNEKEKISSKIEIERPRKLVVGFKSFNFDANMSLTLSNIQLKSGDKIYKIKDFAKFIAKDANIKSLNDKIIIFPQKKDFVVVYYPPLNFKAKLVFEVELIIIIFLVTFLIFNKLLNYLINQIQIKNRTKSDIIFLAGFFIILFLPMLYIDQSERSLTENRKLAQFAPLFKDWKFNFNFGKDFDNWFNDRFFLRKNYLKLDVEYKLLNKIAKNKSFFYDKKHKIIYEPEFSGLEAPDEIEKNNQLKIYLNKLNRFQKFCDKNNIKLYILIAPRMSDFFEYSVWDKNFKKKDFGEEIVEYIQEKSDIKIIYPKKALLEENKNNLIYYATDNHLTKKGNFISYQELMKEIKKDYINVQILNEANFSIYYDNSVEPYINHISAGFLFKSFGLSKKHKKKVLDKKYLYYKIPTISNVQRKELKLSNDKTIQHIDESFFNKDGANLNVLLMGNSFARTMQEFIYLTFKNTTRLYDNYREFDMEFYEKEIKKIKPDIIILTFQTSYFDNALKMYEER